jgi:dethiobiotin synthetase
MDSKRHQYIITGIGTDVGKTVVSAIFAQALNATYWKPVQAGDLGNSDSIKVNNWTDEKVTVLHEAFRLTEPMSPHAAATIDGLHIDLESIDFPEIEGNFIIEGAGGLLVPVNNDGLLYADLFKAWNLPVIVVSRHYLGSINHTLLTMEVLKNRNIPVEGIVFVGAENQATESVILKVTGSKMITRIPLTDELGTEFIQSEAKRLRESWVTIQNDR